jgi:hypothetical protein
MSTKDQYIQFLQQTFIRLGKWLNNLVIKDIVMYDKQGIPLMTCTVEEGYLAEIESSQLSRVELGNGQIGLCYFYEGEVDGPRNLTVHGSDQNGAAFSFRTNIND